MLIGTLYALLAGLIWGLIAGDPVGFQAKVFFLVCVVVAGIYGAITVNPLDLVRLGAGWYGGSERGGGATAGTAATSKPR